jgi:FkbM family methyltransferase
VVALEPDVDNLALLRENVAPLGARVTVLEGGLWGAPGWLRVVDPSDGPASLRTEPAEPGSAGAVRAWTVDEIAALRGSAAPFIVKLDIEGAQAGVFAGDTGWLARCDLVTLELDDWQFPWQATSLAFLRSVAQHRYDVLIGGESLFCFRHTGGEPAR